MVIVAMTEMTKTAVPIDGELDTKEDSSERKFIRDALHVGFLVDELIRAETLLLENVQSPVFASVDRGAGHISHPRPLASRITEAVADLRLKKSRKSWKGSLPKLLSPLCLRLRDAIVKDLTHPNSLGKANSLSELCNEWGREVDFSPMEKES